MAEINNQSKTITMAWKVTSPFTYKGKQYAIGEDITMDAKHAGRYEKLNYVKPEKKVKAAKKK